MSRSTNILLSSDVDSECNGRTNASVICLNGSLFIMTPLPSIALQGPWNTSTCKSSSSANASSFTSVACPQSSQINTTMSDLPSHANSDSDVNSIGAFITLTGLW